MKVLKPILDKNSFSAPIEDFLNRLLFDLIYRPVLQVLKDEYSRRLSSKSSLLSALRDGWIKYESGYFSGQFSVAVSRDLRSLGGTFDQKKKAFKLDWSFLPQDVKFAISQGRDRAEQISSNFINKVDGIKDEAMSAVFQVDWGSQLKTVFYDLNRQYIKTAADAVRVNPELTEETIQALTTDYVNNMNLDIKNWTDEATKRLREKTQTFLFQGFRADKLASVIRSESDKMMRHNRFIARQEMSLLVSKYRETRYKSAGIRQYKWSTSQDSRVRDDHKDLNGKIFSFDNPPIVDKSTGRRANPGEDFHCRCVARPVLEE